MVEERSVRVSLPHDYLMTDAAFSAKKQNQYGNFEYFFHLFLSTSLFLRLTSISADETAYPILTIICHDWFTIAFSFLFSFFFFCRDNFLFIDFFFRELSYQRIQQQEAYDFFALLSKLKLLNSDNNNSIVTNQ